jgi:hypothetical protein
MEQEIKAAPGINAKAARTVKAGHFMDLTVSEIVCGVSI